MNTIGITPEEWNFFNGIVRNTQEVKLKDVQFKQNHFFIKLIKQIMTDVPYVTKILQQLVNCFTIMVRLKNSGQLLKTGYK